MNKLFESWQRYLDEDEDENIDKPKVVCNCLCTDCVFNISEQCVDPVNEAGESGTIDLDWTKTEDGRWICECLTYKVGEGQAPGPEEESEVTSVEEPITEI